MIVHLTFEGEFLYNDRNLSTLDVRANYKFIIYYPLYLRIGSNENEKNTPQLYLASDNKKEN